MKFKNRDKRLSTIVVFKYISMLSFLTSLRESSASSLYNSKILVENTTVYQAEGEFNAEAQVS